MIFPQLSIFCWTWVCFVKDSLTSLSPRRRYLSYLLINGQKAEKFSPATASGPQKRSLKTFPSYSTSLTSRYRFVYFYVIPHFDMFPAWNFLRLHKHVLWGVFVKYEIVVSAGAAKLISIKRDSVWLFSAIKALLCFSKVFFKTAPLPVSNLLALFIVSWH